jgi:hypothetical protein
MSYKEKSSIQLLAGVSSQLLVCRKTGKKKGVAGEPRPNHH